MAIFNSKLLVIPTGEASPRRNVYSADYFNADCLQCSCEAAPIGPALWGRGGGLKEWAPQKNKLSGDSETVDFYSSLEMLGTWFSFDCFSLDCQRLPWSKQRMPARILMLMHLSTPAKSSHHWVPCWGNLLIRRFGIGVLWFPVVFWYVHHRPYCTVTQLGLSPNLDFSPHSSEQYSCAFRSP